MKKKTLARILSAAAACTAVLGLATFAGCSSSGGSNTPPPPPPATKTTYSGTLYMASEAGGHIAVVPVTIDPSNTTTPIVVDTANLTKIQLSLGTGGSNTTHVFHDLRLDDTAKRLYYSAIFSSTAADENGKIHLGYIDLNDNSKHDTTIDADPATDQGGGNFSGVMFYCGSGQTNNYYVPMTMSYPAYIDAIPKADVATSALVAGSNVKRSFVDDFRKDANPDYIFAHGNTSPDGSKLYVAVNETTAGHGGMMGEMKGEITAYLLDTNDVVAGSVGTTSVLKSNSIPGLATAGASIAFRSSFTPDGKILQAGSDRFLVLDASTLQLLDSNQADRTKAGAIGGSYYQVDNHDAMSTPDGKYAILSLRFSGSANGALDSGIQLYDLANKKAIGNPVSTCNACHKLFDPAADTIDRKTCAVVGTLTAKTQ